MTQLKAAATARWDAVRRRARWLDHAVRAWGEYKRNRGDLFAGAVTFFSFLSLFPLILLGVSIAGFVLQSQPEWQERIFDGITDNVPGTFGTTVKSAIDTAISARASVGLIGLAALLITGLGWVANLRAAIEGVWGQEAKKRPLVMGKLSDLLVLAGLGLGALLSVAFTVCGSALSTQVLQWVGLDDVAGLGLLTRVVSISLGVIGDVLIFAWLLVRLPRVDVPMRVALSSAVLASIGFEALKLGGTYYIAQVTKSPTAGIFGSVIGILVWLNLVFRFLLLCVAWTATSPRLLRTVKAVEVERLVAVESVPPATAKHAAPSPQVNPAATAAVLVGAGAAAGAGLLAAARHRRR